MYKPAGPDFASARFFCRHTCPLSFCRESLSILTRSYPESWCVIRMRSTLLLLPEWREQPGEQKASFVSPLDKKSGSAPCLAPMHAAGHNKDLGVSRTLDALVWMRMSFCFCFFFCLLKRETKAKNVSVKD